MKKSSSALVMLVPIILFFSSCSDSSKQNDVLFSMLSEGFEASTNNITVSTEMTFHRLGEKLTDPGTADRARIWHPMARRIIEYTSDILSYLKRLKQKKNLDKQQATELYTRCITYRANLYKIDPKIKIAFENSITLFTRSFDSSASQVDNFHKTFFNGISHDAFLAVLNRFLNNIKILENKFVIFCNDQVGIIDDSQDAFAVIAVANKNYLKSGEFIEITTGVGGFSTRVNPEFIINRQDVKIDNGDGAAHYKMKVPLKPGNYSVPVKVKYTDPYGIKHEVELNIKYTVAKPCDQ